ncbi:MAG: enolase C-terminal domain-like protein [Simkaniaceae bacterium]|nr:enolase C-terminal domain-like protein [Simkaniaceae bacterium]
MRYKPYSNQFRKGMILEDNGKFAEAAPLPGFSIETYDEMCAGLKTKDRSIPSVSFALESLEIPFPSPKEPPMAHFGNDETFHNTIKLKLGDLSLDDAISQTKQAQKFCKNLRVDMNGKWPLEKAIAYSAAFAKNTFEFIEEPCENLLPFLENTIHPIAVDEHLRTLPLDQILSLPIKAAVIKPMLHGGFSILKPLVEKLKSASITPVISSTYETSIGLTHLKDLYYRLELTTAAGLDTEKLL